MAVPNYFGRMILCAFVPLTVCAAVTSISAAEPRPTSRDVQAAATATPPVDLIAAIDEGIITVRFIPRSSREATLLVTNKSERPLSVRLPESFVGVPVLAQRQNNPFGNLFQGGQQQQSGGGGSAPQGLGSGGDQALFNIAPEKVKRIKVDCVCLDHGHPEPSAKMPYQVQKSETYVDRPEVVELLKSMGGEGVSREAVQAAAWHLNNGLTWQRLAAQKSGERRLVGTDPPMFTRGELESARRLADAACKVAGAAASTSDRSGNPVRK